MKLAFIAASIAATANIQALELGATCQTGTDAVEKLVIKIPYPDERTAKLLSLEAGDCDVNNYGGSMTWAAGVATLSIPIDDCAMRGELYGTPVTTRSYGLYRPTATVTFGQRMGDVDVVFRSLPIAAECGKKTSYTVEFNYNNVTSADTEGCTIVNGVCVFPAYGDDAKFEIKEYTDDNFNVEVDENTRARIAGNPIHLSMRVTGLADEAKFAVTTCKIVDGDKELVLLNPGAESNPSCEMNEIGLSAKYELSNGDFVFNFQHILFLLRKTQQESASTFSLQCSVEICEKTDASSKCNTAAAVCLDSDQTKTDYICGDACSVVGNVCAVSTENQPSCSEGSCPASAGGSMITVDGEQVCTIAADNNPYKSSTIMRDLYWADYPTVGSQDFGGTGDNSGNINRAIDDDWIDDDYISHGGDLVASISPAVIVNTVMVRPRKGGWFHRYSGMNAELNFDTADSVWCQPRNELSATFVSQNTHNALYFDCTRAVVASSIKLYKDSRRGTGGVPGSNVDDIQLNEILLAYNP